MANNKNNGDFISLTRDEKLPQMEFNRVFFFEIKLKSFHLSAKKVFFKKAQQLFMLLEPHYL